jgi:hemerythrin
MDLSLELAFKNTMKRMVDYVHFHFSEEIVILERIGFPQVHEHKKQHETLVKDILEAVRDYNEGNKFVPNAFVRTLKEWILGHIGIYDQIYAAFIADQKKKGLLTDKDIED